MQSVTKSRDHGFAAWVRSSRMRVGAALTLLLTIGCSDGADMAGLAGGSAMQAAVATSETGASADPHALPKYVQVLRGNRQTGMAGQPLSDVLRVRVNNGYGRPMPNTPVTWAITRGGGTLSRVQTTTDSKGITEVTWNLGTTRGMQYAKATSGPATGWFEANSVAASGWGTPATVTTLRADSSRDDRIYVHFTEVDDGTGRPASYTMRYAVSPIGTGWGSAADVVKGSCRSLTGRKIGSVRHCWIDGLRKGETYDVQMIAWRHDMYRVRVTSRRPSNVVTMQAGGSSSASESLSISPSSLTLSSGATRQLSATAHDANGLRLNRPVQWTSSNDAIATVSPDGTVRGRSTGRASITALTAGASASVAVTVLAPQTTGSTDPWPNEPSDFTRTIDEKFNSRSLTTQPAGRWYWGNGGATTPNLQLASGADGTALRWIYAAGRRAGDSPGRAVIESTSSQFKSYYIGIRIRWSDPWTSHSSGVNKILYWGSIEARERTRIGPNQYFLNRRGSVIDLTLQYAQDEGQTNVPGSTDRRIASTRVDDGRWHHVELRVDGNDAGRSNCRIRVWVDGILNVDVGNLVCTSGASKFYGINLDPVWGGVGGAKPQTDWLELDHLRVSGR